VESEVAVAEKPTGMVEDKKLRKRNFLGEKGQKRVNLRALWLLIQ
jgi:hypothetical protein